MIPLSEERKEVRDTKKEEMMIGMRDKFATDEKEKETQADQEMTSSLSVSFLFGLIYFSLFFFLSYEQKTRLEVLSLLLHRQERKKEGCFPILSFSLSSLVSFTLEKSRTILFQVSEGEEGKSEKETEQKIHQRY